ncbi:MAG: hypothetical protein P8N76_17190 [Pirellulaceae bacterium]|nr:hypothetical protein [Pirellulaceae bacterium]
MYSFILNSCLPVALKVTRSNYWQMRRSIQKWQRRSRNQIRELQLSSLKAIVEHAAEKVPFYRDRFREAGFDPKSLRGLDDISRLPITTKKDIQLNFPDRMLSEDVNAEDLRFLGTRGTTNRLMIAQDFSRRDHARATQLFVQTEDASYRVGKRQLTIPPDACSVVCGVEGMRERTVSRHLLKMLREGSLLSPSLISDLRGLVMNNWIDNATILPPLDSSGGDAMEVELERYVKTVSDLRPALLFALPEYLIWLARFVKENQLELRIPEIRPMGANMSRSARQFIESHLGGSVREHYGSLELGNMAFDCQEKSGMHLLEDQFFIETTDRRSAVESGGLGSVTVTDFHNFVMPLIRYQVGDVARVDNRNCDCGRTSRRITLEGRVDDTFVIDDRWITPEAVAEFFTKFDDVFDFQLVEKRSGRWELLYVANYENVDESELQQACLQVLGGGMLKVRRVQRIIPEASGKFRHCKSSSHFLINQAAGK